VVVVHAIGPALAPVDRKTTVLLITVLHRVVADKIGHRLLSRGPERVLTSLSRLEEHVTFTIRVELPSCLGSCLNIVAFVLVNLRDIFDSASPRILHSDDFFLGDARVVRH